MNLSQTLNANFTIDEPLTLVLSVGFTLTIVFFSSFVLNIISFRSIWNQKEFTIINTLILNLVIADLTYTMGIPFFIYQLFSHSWLMGKFGCKIFIFFEFCGIIVGIFTVCALSVERYFDVTKCIKKTIDSYSNKFKIFVTLLYIVILWLFSAIYILPFVFSIDLFKMRNTYECNSNWSDNYLKIYFMFKFFAIFFMPFCVILFCSMKILIFLIKWKINANSEKRSWISYIFGTNSPQKELLKKLVKVEKSETNTVYQTIVCNYSFKSKKVKICYLSSIRRKAIILVLAIVFMFLVQWLPLWIFQFFVLFSNNQFQSIQLINMLSSTLSYSNTIANPLIYIILTNKFTFFSNCKNSYKQT